MESTHEKVTDSAGSAPATACGKIPPNTARLPFWQRQFGHRSTLGQKLFDLLAGVVLPVVCVWLDPVIFTSEGSGLASPFSKYAVFGYAFILVEILVLLLLLLLDRRLGIMGGFVAGMLLAGALFAGLLGLVILPLTFIGLFILIGVLGLSPFITSFVFLRNGIRALHGDNARRRPLLRWLFAILGVALAIGAPAVAQREVNHLVFRLAQVNGEDQPEKRAAEIEQAQCVVRLLGVGTVDPLVDAYDQEENPAAKKRIEDTYRFITGDDIKNRLGKLRD